MLKKSLLCSAVLLRKNRTHRPGRNIAINLNYLLNEIMFKNFLAFYGAMRLLEDVSRPSPPNKNNDGNSALGCGCLVVIIIIILASCAGS